MSEPAKGLRGPPHTSLATKIILFVFVSTFVTATAVSWASLRSAYAQSRDLAGQQFRRAAVRCAETLDTWLDQGSAELRALAGASALPRAMPASSHFDGFAWLDAKARPRLALGSAARLDAGMREALIAGAPLASPAGEVGPVAAIERWSVRDGFVVGLYRRDMIERLLLDDTPHSDAAMLVADSQGRVIASAGPNAATQLTPPDALEDPEELVRSYRNESGRTVLGVVQALGSSGWQVAVEVPLHGVLSPLLSTATLVFVLDLALVLLFSLLAYWITTTWVKPIGTLSDTARRIAQGNLDQEIPEPSTDDEIGLLTHTFNDMIRKLRRKQEEIESANRTLRSRNEVLAQLSITDGLTHLHNHRFFQDHLGREIKRVMRLGEPLSMLLVDIDDFKGLNDRLGHAAGDELLSGMARIMSHCVRDSDLLARYGGEEFVVLASNTDRAGAYQLAEKVRMNIEEASFILDDSMRPVRITVSIGVAQFAGDRKGFFEAADQALYRAKAAGKNCVVADEPVEEQEAAAS